LAAKTLRSNPAEKNPGTRRSQNDNGLVLLGAIQRRVQIGKHCGRHHIHLAVVHGDVGDAGIASIGHALSHLVPPFALKDDVDGVM
jgi:hypothetical protein